MFFRNKYEKHYNGHILTSAYIYIFSYILMHTHIYVIKIQKNNDNMFTLVILRLVTGKKGKQIFLHAHLLFACS